MSAETHEQAGSVVAPASPARVSSRYDNRITLQKLEVFCTVIELGGVSRAADHLWVAQSVVSGHLRSLQERLGVQVLYRDGQRMRLTKAGEQVYQWASEMLSGTRDLMRRLDDLDDANSGTLALAASLAVGSYLMPPILAEFRNVRPRVIITIDCVGSRGGVLCGGIGRVRSRDRHCGRWARAPARAFRRDRPRGDRGGGGHRIASPGSRLSRYPTSLSWPSWLRSPEASHERLSTADSSNSALPRSTL